MTEPKEIRGFDNQRFAEIADIRFESDGPFGSNHSVYLNGFDISDWVSEVRVEATGEGDRLPLVWLAFPAKVTWNTEYEI